MAQTMEAVRAAAQPALELTDVWPDTEAGGVLIFTRSVLVVPSARPACAVENPAARHHTDGGGGAPADAIRGAAGIHW